MARSTIGRSPPGSITTARFVAPHHNSVLFCWKGVTGLMSVFALRMDVVYSIKAGLVSEGCRPIKHSVTGEIGTTSTVMGTLVSS